MRLRTLSNPDTGDVYLNRDDLVGALREQAPTAAEPSVRDAFAQLAELLATRGGPPTRDPRAPVIGGKLWTPGDADAGGLL